MKSVQAELKRLHSPDAISLEDFKPDGPFGILLQAMVGPLGTQGEEAFDIVVCTPEWFSDQMQPISSGHHYLFVRQYDYVTLKRFIEEYCVTCMGATWAEVAEKVGRIGKWEFEDYKG